MGWKLEHKKNIYGGKLLVFTGIDGAGKTTLLNFAEKYLESCGMEVYKTKMPSDRIRKMPVFRIAHDSFDKAKREAVSQLALTVLLSGDRLIVMDEEVIPALKQNKWVLLDRYQYTAFTISYELNQLVKDISSEFIHPDRVFLADVPVELAEKRVKNRPEEKYRYYDLEKAKREKEVFKKIAQSNEFFQIVDTSDDISIAFSFLENGLKTLVDDFIC